MTDYPRITGDNKSSKSLPQNASDHKAGGPPKMTTKTQWQPTNLKSKGK